MSTTLKVQSQRFTERPLWEILIQTQQETFSGINKYVTNNWFSCVFGGELVSRETGSLANAVLTIKIFHVQATFMKIPR